MVSPCGFRPAASSYISLYVIRVHVYPYLARPRSHADVCPLVEATERALEIPPPNQKFDSRVRDRFAVIFCWIFSATRKEAPT